MKRKTHIGSWLRRFGAVVNVACMLSSAHSVRAEAQTPQAASPNAATPNTAAAKRPVLSSDEYEHLLNLLFPVDTTTPLGVDYTMVLRFESFHHPESQITIRHWHDGHNDATLARVTTGNAWREAFGKKKADGEADFTQIMKSVDVKTFRFLLDSRQVQQWHAEMFPVMSKEFAHVRQVDRKLRRSGNTEVATLGTRYELFFVEPDDEMQATAWDSEVEALPTGSTDLTKWMNAIRFYAENHLAGQVAPMSVSSDAVRLGAAAAPVATPAAKAAAPSTAVTSTVTSVVPAKRR